MCCLSKEGVRFFSQNEVDSYIVEDFYFMARLWVPPHARLVLLGPDLSTALAADHWNEPTTAGCLCLLLKTVTSSSTNITTCRGTPESG